MFDTEKSNNLEKLSRLQAHFGYVVVMVVSPMKIGTRIRLGDVFLLDNRRHFAEGDFADQPLVVTEETDQDDWVRQGLFLGQDNRARLLDVGRFFYRVKTD